MTDTYTSRSIANFIHFLDQVDARIPAESERVYAVMDNLAVHKSYDVLLFNLAPPRWEFVFQPKYAAYLNLIEPWWKTLKSLALKGRYFGTWEEVEVAVREACTYWNSQRRPYLWGGVGGIGSRASSEWQALLEWLVFSGCTTKRGSVSISWQGANHHPCRRRSLRQLRC